MGLFSKLFDPTAGELKRLNKMVDQIDAFEEAHKQLTDAQLRAKTQEFRDRLANGETLDALLPEAFSVVREATFRVTGKRQFRVQMMGGIVLHQGRIAERKTGPSGSPARRVFDWFVVKSVRFCQSPGCSARIVMRPSLASSRGKAFQ